jgi:hypothetical protein
MKWPWSRGVSPEAAEEVDKRLDRIAEDSKKVDQLDQRVRKIMREDSLAPAIIKALRLR